MNTLINTLNILLARTPYCIVRKDGPKVALQRILGTNVTTSRAGRQKEPVEKRIQASYVRTNYWKTRCRKLEEKLKA